MTKEEFSEKLKKIESDHGGDTRVYHEVVDVLMISALTDLGYDLGTFNTNDVWYE